MGDYARSERYYHDSLRYLQDMATGEAREVANHLREAIEAARRNTRQLGEATDAIRRAVEEMRDDNRFQEKHTIQVFEMMTALQDKLGRFLETDRAELEATIARLLATSREVGTSLAVTTPATVRRRTRVHFPSICRIGKMARLEIQLTVDGASGSDRFDGASGSDRFRIFC